MRKKGKARNEVKRSRKVARSEKGYRVMHMLHRIQGLH